MPILPLPLILAICGLAALVWVIWVGLEFGWHELPFIAGIILLGGGAIFLIGWVAISLMAHLLDGGA